MHRLRTDLEELAVEASSHQSSCSDDFEDPERDRVVLILVPLDRHRVDHEFAGDELQIQRRLAKDPDHPLKELSLALQNRKVLAVPA